MFDFDAGKLIVIGIVALIAIPSKDLPRVLRQVGQAVGRVRRMAAEFQGQFLDAMRESELHEMREDFEKEQNKIKAEVDSAMAGVGLSGSFDPLTEARKQIVDAVETPIAPAAETSAAETPAPETSTPETSAPELPAPETPAALPPPGIAAAPGGSVSA